MLCGVCHNAFREDVGEDETKPPLLRCDTLLETQKAPSSPFYKAVHHSLPGLKQSASSGCSLCILLWSSAPSEVQNFCEKILRSGRHVHWLPCHFTVDRSVFRTQSSPKRLLVEYKYHTVHRSPENYVQPLKRHFRLLSRQGDYSQLIDG